MKQNKIIAKEILIFISTICVLSLIYLFLLFQNIIIDLKIKSQNQKIAAIQAQMDTVPTDQIKIIYTLIESVLDKTFETSDPPFSVYYLNPTKSIWEKYKVNKNSNISKEKELEYADIEQYRVKPDSMIFFKWVNLEEFRKLMKDPTYRNYLLISMPSDLGLGSRSQYNRRIQIGLKYTEKAKVLADNLTTTKHKIEISLNKTKPYHLDTPSKLYYFFWIGIVFLILIYPVRFLYLLVVWSIKTLKASE